MAWVGAVINALSCSDLYKYVFNSMRCKSDCCKHYLICDCETDAVDIQSSDDEKFCCLGGKADSDTSEGPDIIYHTEV
jgi:hypothetical protein